MKKATNIWMIILSFFYVSGYAQYTTVTDTLSNTVLTSTMPDSLEKDLKKLEGNCERIASLKTESTSTSRSSVNVPKRTMTTRDICRQHPKIMGVKIQIDVVKSSAEANRLKANFRRKFPYIKVETNAKMRPNYRILAGSYFTKESAASDLRKIRAYFGSARTVPYRVFCEESK